MCGCFGNGYQHSSTTLTEVFPRFFLSCKANASVKLAKTGHGPHSSKLVVICVVLSFLCCSVVIVLYCYLYCSMYCLCVLYHCHRVLTQLQLTYISKTSPTAWQPYYSYAVQSATSSDSHKATSAVVQLLGNVENCFKLSLLWRRCINGTSSGQVCTRQRERSVQMNAVQASQWLPCLFLTLSCCKTGPNCCKINGTASGHIHFPYISTMYIQ